MRATLFAFGMAALGGMSLSAQSTSFGGTQIGFVYDSSSRGLRPVVGVIGAAYLGSPVATGLDRAVVSPDGSFALTRRGDESKWLNTANVELNGSLPAWRQAAWCGSSQFVLLAAEGNRIDWWERQNATWTLAYSATDSIPAGDIALLACDASRREVWVSLRSTQESSVPEGSVPEEGLYRLSREGDSQKVIALPQAGALALPNSKDSAWYAADLKERRIYRLLREQNDWTWTILQDGDPASGPVPVALRLLENGKLLSCWKTEDAAAPSLRLYNGAAGALESEQSVDGIPSVIEPLSSSGLLRINSPEEASLPLLVFDSALEKVFFIPVGSSL